MESKAAPVEEYYHYHSFPRRGKNSEEESGKGLAILESIARSGFLLTPEVTDWPGEFKADGTRLAGPLGVSCRVCFTYLRPAELTGHAQSFGAFALEIDNASLRTLGGMPVMYVPLADALAGYLQIGATIPARLCDVQQLLERLNDFMKVASFCDPNTPMVMGPRKDGGLSIGPEQGTESYGFPQDMVRFDRSVKGKDGAPDPKAVERIGATAGSVVTLLKALGIGQQPFPLQLNAFSHLGGFFSPCERPRKPDMMTYYQQREWRILADMRKRDVYSSRKPTADEIERLRELDKWFFEWVEFRDSKRPRHTQCRFMTTVDDRHVLTYVRRVICPRAAVEKARTILTKLKFEGLPVVAMEDLGQ